MARPSAIVSQTLRKEFNEEALRSKEGNHENIYDAPRHATAVRARGGGDLQR